MGIYKFSSWYNNQNNQYTANTTFIHPPRYTNILAVDANGIFHTVMAKAKPDDTMTMIGERIWAEIARLVELIKPTDALLIAVDGVPPAAKIQQQRSRRFTKALDNQIARSRGEPIGYDSNAINPGTQWMRTINAQLATLIKKLTRSSAAVTESWPRQIILSTDLSPGEGEHKIASYMRQMMNNTRSHKYRRNFVVHGADSDLFMIFLNIIDRKDSWNVYLMREQVNPRTEVLTRRYINLRNLKNNLVRLWPKSCNPAQDFIFLMNLIGNDFLPHFVCMESISASLTTLFDAYTEFLEQVTAEKCPNDFVSRGASTGDLSYTSLVFDDNKINWVFFAEFLDYLQYSRERTLIREVLAERKFVDNINVYRDILGPDPSNEDFRHLVYTYNSQFARTGARPGPDVTYRDSDYRKAQNARIANIYRDRSQTTYRKSFIDEQCKHYLQIMTWAYTYYIYGAEGVNVDAYYPYLYSPHLFDLAGFIRKEGSIQEIEGPILNMRGTFLSPTEQMLAVMPHSSHHHIRSDFRPITRLIHWNYPRKFGIDVNMKLELFMGTTMIQPANLDTIRAVVKEYIHQFKLRGDSITVDEYQRDQVTLLIKR